MPDSLLDKYQILNNSFKKRVVFRLGDTAGFFSEYNNMILCMLYCLNNRIRFELCSIDANFSNRLGWLDYFEPFCCEFNHVLTYNRRNIPNRRRKKVMAEIQKRLYRVDYLTYDLWNCIRSRELEKKEYDIGDLGIIGTIQDACKPLVQLTWRYNDDTKTAISKLIKTLNLPSSYVGFHIRGGDKYLEMDIKHIREYVSKAETLTNEKNVFILTDDYSIIESFQIDYPQWNIYTMCQESERGYFHLKFQQENKEYIRNAHLRLFAAVDILSGASLFVGTFSSNPGMYLGMRMDKEKVHGVDLDCWQIW